MALMKADCVLGRTNINSDGDAGDALRLQMISSSERDTANFRKKVRTEDDVLGGLQNA